MRIETRDKQGQVNGWLCPIWNVLDGPSVDQVYLTVINHGAMKGPHLHMKRRGLFKVIHGTVRLVIRNSQGIYLSTDMDVDSDPIPVSPGVPAALYNLTVYDDAYVLNMPSPSWRPDDMDEHEVENWNYTHKETERRR